jgi:phage-related protein
LAAGVQVVGSLASGLAGAIPKIFAIGGNLITGLWNGMNNKLQWLKDKISSFTSSVIASIKSFFGVHSPSTVFAEIGGNLSAGLAEGISDKAGLVTSAMNRLNGQLTASATIGASEAGAGSGYGVAVSNIYMDSVLVASGTGKAQYRKNRARARSLGVVTA